MKSRRNIQKDVVVAYRASAVQVELLTLAIRNNQLQDDTAGKQSRSPWPRKKSTDDIPVLTEVVAAETGVTEEKAELPEDTGTPARLGHRCAPLAISSPATCPICSKRCKRSNAGENLRADHRHHGNRPARFHRPPQATACPLKTRMTEHCDVGWRTKVKGEM